MSPFLTFLLLTASSILVGGVCACEGYMGLAALAAAHALAMAVSAFAAALSR
jgi:hypothetical protein